MSNSIKAALIFCVAWQSNLADGQHISGKLWRHADEILLVSVIKEERSSFGALSIGTRLTHVTAEIVTAYKVKRIDTARRDLTIPRIFGCHQPVNSDEGLLNPKKQYVVFLSSDYPPGKWNIYSLTDDHLGIVEYTDELNRVLKSKKK